MAYRRSTVQYITSISWEVEWGGRGEWVSMSGSRMKEKKKKVNQCLDPPSWETNKKIESKVLFIYLLK